MKNTLIGIFLFALALGASAPADAKPIAQTSVHGIVMTLTDEPCALKDRVDLPYRGTWDEKGKRYEGCFGLNHLGIVMMYFNDKSVAAFPPGAFTEVTGV